MEFDSAGLQLSTRQSKGIDMFNSTALLEISHRADQSFGKLLEHCRCLTDEEINREIDGFGDPSVKHQLHHAISARKYWIGVLQGRIDADEVPEGRFTIDNMMDYHRSVVKISDSYLESASPDELATPRPMMTWGNNERTLVPVHVVMRTIVHLYHHFGKVAAMCRIMNKPIAPGMDYPIIP
jgi:uncharacterized damage-inducible protein DinB